MKQPKKPRYDHTARDIAVKLGVSSTIVRKWLKTGTGPKNPHLAKLYKACK